jgi:hypothetical protein
VKEILLGYQLELMPDFAEPPVTQEVATIV